jgi:hypothetical protein
MPTTRILLCQADAHRMTVGYACSHGAWCTIHLERHLRDSEPCRRTFLETMERAIETLQRAAVTHYPALLTAARAVVHVWDGCTPPTGGEG